MLKDMVSNMSYRVSGWYGKEGHEGKTAFIDNLLNHYDYQEILADVPRSNDPSLN